MKYRNYNSPFEWGTKSKSAKIFLITLLVVFVGVILYLSATILKNYGIYLENKNLATSDATQEEATQTSLKVTFISFEKTWNMAMEELFADFEKENPDIKIEYDIISETGLYEDALNKLYARDELGDVVEILEPMNYIVTGLMMPIPEEIAQQSTEQFLYDEQVYAVGTVGYTTGIIYNRKIFEEYELEVPTTYEEFLNVCQVLKDAGETPLVVGGANRWHLTNLLNYYYLKETAGTDSAWLESLNPMVDTGRWDDPTVLNTLSNMRELFDLGFVTPLWSDITNDTAASYLAEGSAVMMYTSTFAIKEVQYQNSVADIGWFYLPDDEGNPLTNDQAHGYWTMMHSCEESQEKMDAAKRFLNYFYREGVYESICNDVVGDPMVSRQTNLLESSFRTAVYDDNITRAEDYNKNLTSSTLPQDFRTYLVNVAKGTMVGKISPEVATDMLQQKWEGIQEEHVYEDFNP